MHCGGWRLSLKWACPWLNKDLHKRFRDNSEELST
jgi:hypothetical protein